MVVQQRARDRRERPHRQGWSLRNYMALFMAVLLAVAAIAAFAVRSMAEQDARQSADADANFAAQRTALQLKAGFDAIQALSVPLAADPGVAQLFADPSKCSIGYAPIAPFDTGHIDIVRLDGSIVCSSRKGVGSTAPIYEGQAWLQAPQPVVFAPVVDPATGNQVAVISYPISGLAHSPGSSTWRGSAPNLRPHLAAESISSSSWSRAAMARPSFCDRSTRPAG
jgi:hypothetical protein